MLAMAAPDMSRESRLLALEVLDRLDQVSGRTHSRLLDQFEYETDPEVLGAALYALPHGQVDPELTERSRVLLSRAAENDDAELRARALLVAGMNVTGDEDIRWLLPRLMDPAPTVRATAAAALRSYRGSDPATVRDALLARINDPSEELAVRRQAWTTLGRLPLDASAYSSWKAYRHSLAGLANRAALAHDHAE